MNPIKHHTQQGATLLIAMVMLVVITVLAISGMRGVALESRISTNRAEMARLQNLTDAALREGEFRFYGPAHLRDKLESSADKVQQNCSPESNKLNAYGNNKPCLLMEMTDAELQVYFENPLDVNPPWLPYRGLDSKSAHYFVSETERQGFFNSYRTLEGAGENEALNPEYGAALEGKGTFFFLVAGQTSEQVPAQSTIAVIYLGLNN